MNPNPLLVGSVPISDGTQRKISRGSAAVTGTLALSLAQTDLASVDAVVASMQTDPGAGAGDPFLVTAVPNVPAAGQITLNVWQDDATAAANPATVHWVAVGT